MNIFKFLARQRRYVTYTYTHINILRNETLKPVVNHSDLRFLQQTKNCSQCDVIGAFNKLISSSYIN